MDIRLVKEGAFSNHEVTRGKAVIESECGMRDHLWHLEDKNAKDAVPGSDLLRQLWACTMLNVVCLLCGLGGVDVRVTVIQTPTKTAFRLRTTA